MPSVARDRAGNYIVGPVVGDELIAVFGADATYRSSFGRTGEGPGEFPEYTMWLHIEVGEGDTLFVIAYPNVLHTLAPRAERSLDQVRLPFSIRDAVVLKGGTIAVQGNVRTEAGITTIQTLRPDGTIESSLAASEADEEDWEKWKNRPENRSGVRWDVRRVFGRSNDRLDIWSAHLNRYRISRYGVDGTEKTRIERIAKWFLSYTFRSPGAPTRAPTEPIVSDVHQDGDGLLWVAIQRAPASFTPIPDSPPGVEAPMDQFRDMNQFLHTTIEVIDPVAGELVARREFDEFVNLVRTPGDDVFIYSFRPDALGDVDCTIRLLKLRRE
ncbi:MAG: hypothetical protein OXK74_01075 [Gemmatimonadota bacterium]|nr:hypothetical protein [Gemmatimonadota bacterium]